MCSIQKHHLHSVVVWTIVISEHRAVLTVEVFLCIWTTYLHEDSCNYKPLFHWMNVCSCLGGAGAAHAD